MPTDSLESALAQAEQEYAEKLKSLEAQHKKKAQSLISNAKVKLADALQSALELLNAIPASYRQEALKDTAIANLLHSFRVSPDSPRKSRASASKPTSRVPDDDILNYLASERTTGDVKAQFEFSSVTVGKRLGKLKEAGKVTMRQDDTKKTRKLWKKT